jgi:tetratricopeptide (TPR) repeat protein
MELKQDFLHDLDREYAGYKLKEKREDTLSLKLVEYYDTVLIKISGMFYLGGKDMLLALDGFDKEWKNIERAQLICKRLYKTNEIAARYCIRICTNGLAVMDVRLPQEVLVEWSEVALRAARRNKDSVSEEKIMGNLGTALSNIGRLDESIPLLIQSIEMARARGYNRGEAESLGNLGNVYRRKGELDKALESHKSAYKISKGYKYVDLQQGDLNNIGNVYNQMLLPEKAREHFLLALDLARTHGNYKVETTVLYGIGSSYLHQFKILKAVKYHRLALVLARKIGATKIEEGILGSYSDLFGGLGLRVIANKFKRDADKVYKI